MSYNVGAQMKVLTKLALATAFLILLGGNAVAALSITGFGITYSENFNTYAGTEVTIPAEFSWSNTDFGPGGIYDASGTYNNSNSSYGLVFGDMSDVSFGQKAPTSGTFFLNWTATNNTGAPIPAFRISWDVEQYSQAGRASTVSLNYNAGSGFTNTGIVGANQVTATTGTPDSNLTAVSTTSRSVLLTLPAPLPNGSSIMFGWVFGNGAGSGSNAHIGVDNLQFVAVPECSSFVFLGMVASGGFATYLRRRRA